MIKDDYIEDLRIKYESARADLIAASATFEVVRELWEKHGAAEPEEPEEQTFPSPASRSFPSPNGKPTKSALIREVIENTPKLQMPSGFTAAELFDEVKRVADARGIEYRNLRSSVTAFVRDCVRGQFKDAPLRDTGKVRRGKGHSKNSNVKVYAVQ